MPKNARSLSDLADLWYELHGKGLASGKGTHRRLLAMSKTMGNPRAEAFTCGHVRAIPLEADGGRDHG
jgi:hypothetical protein